MSNNWQNIADNFRGKKIKPVTPYHLLSKTDMASVDPDMSYAIRKYHFWTWWKYGDCGESMFHDRDELRKIVNRVRAYCGLAPYSEGEFDKGWQYRNVLADDYKVARDEMFNLCFGWW